MQTNKLKNFPSVYYISLEESKDRHENIVKQFSEYGIIPTVILSKRFSECNDEVTGKFLYQLNGGTIGTIVSHLKAIRKWYEETNEDYAFFCEDDLSLETVKYWDFTWEEFIESIPDDAMCVQLHVIREEYETFDLRKREWNDWAATAFILNREYAKILIDTYCVGENKFNLELPSPRDNIMPLGENILYATVENVAYSIPLFVEEIKFNSTFSSEDDADVKNGQKTEHVNSYHTVINYWKNRSNTFEFDWGCTDPEYIQLFSNENFVERIYEKYCPVKEGDVVVDIGANCGSFTYSILDKNPKHVYCIEPSDTLINCLEHNVGNGPVTIINKAISDCESYDKLIPNKGVFIGYNKSHTYSTTTFKNVIEKYQIDKIDFLKFDCEGGEYFIFTEENYEFIRNNVRHYSGEWHINDHENSIEKFIQFRNLYLKDYENLYVYDRTGKDITQNIFDDEYLYEFKELWKDTYLGQFIIYVTYNLSKKESHMNIEELLTKYSHDTENDELNFQLGMWYESQGHTAPAVSYYLRCAERSENSDLVYEALLRCYFCYEKQGERNGSSRSMIFQAQAFRPDRPEAYFLMSQYSEKREWWQDCYMDAHLALLYCNFDQPPLRTDIGYPGKYGLLFEKAISGWWWGKVEECKSIFLDLRNNYPLNEHHKKLVDNNLKNIFKNDPNFAQKDFGFKQNFSWGDLSYEDIITIEREIINEKVYRFWEDVKEGDVVLDIGASVGAYTVSILDQKPKKVYCVEPSKKLLKTLSDNCFEKTLEYLDNPLVYINYGIVDKDTDKINIFGGEDTFKGITFKKLIEDYSIDHVNYMKVDCEGGEYSIFKEENMDFLLNKVDFISIEMHLNYSGCREKFKQFRDKYLIQFKNYKVMSCTRQNISWGNSLDLKDKIFDNDFIDNYSCEFMIYMKNI